MRERANDVSMLLRVGLGPGWSLDRLRGGDSTAILFLEEMCVRWDRSASEDEVA